MHVREADKGFPSRTYVVDDGGPNLELLTVFAPSAAKGAELEAQLWAVVARRGAAIVDVIDGEDALVAFLAGDRGAVVNAADDLPPASFDPMPPEPQLGPGGAHVAFILDTGAEDFELITLEVETIEERGELAARLREPLAARDAHIIGVLTGERAVGQFLAEKYLARLEEDRTWIAGLDAQAATSMLENIDRRRHRETRRLGNLQRLAEQIAGRRGES